MNTFILTSWLCLASAPNCPSDHAASHVITHEWANREECESVADELLALNPAPSGYVARRTCEPKGTQL